jgi:hypothetical protein
LAKEAALAEEARLAEEACLVEQKAEQERLALEAAQPRLAEEVWLQHAQLQAVGSEEKGNLGEAKTRLKPKKALPRSELLGVNKKAFSILEKRLRAQL